MKLRICVAMVTFMIVISMPVTAFARGIGGYPPPPGRPRVVCECEYCEYCNIPDYDTSD